MNPAARFTPTSALRHAWVLGDWRAASDEAAASAGAQLLRVGVAQTRQVEAAVAALTRTPAPSDAGVVSPTLPSSHSPVPPVAATATGDLLLAGEPAAPPPTPQSAAPVVHRMRGPHAPYIPGMPITVSDTDLAVLLSPISRVTPIVLLKVRIARLVRQLRRRIARKQGFRDAAEVAAATGTSPYGATLKLAPGAPPPPPHLAAVVSALEASSVAPPSTLPRLPSSAYATMGGGAGSMPVQPQTVEDVDEALMELGSSLRRPNMFVG